MKRINKSLKGLIMCATILGNGSLEAVRQKVAAKRTIPHSLATAIRAVYQPAGFAITGLEPETESCEYGACRFSMGEHHVVFREAKTTPTKIGQFVTIWKRPRPGAEIAPLDLADGVDFLIVRVSDATHSGQFVFSRDLLIQKGIMSTHGKGGKRAIRIYPPWSRPTAKDAIKTQRWQLPYFFPTAADGTADSEQVLSLFQ